MVLDILKSGKTNLEIALDRQSAYHPGDPIRAHLSLQTENEQKIRQGRFVLLCEEKFKVRSSHHDSHGTHYSQSWQSDLKELNRHVFLEEGVIPAHFFQDYNIEWQIPVEALPTFEGSIIKVHWWVKATLDRKMAADVNSETGLVVNNRIPYGRSGQGFSPLGLQQYRDSSHPEDVDLSFWLPRKEWVIGETIEGRLTIQAHKNIRLTDIRVEVVQIERVPKHAGNENQSSIRQNLASSTEASAGQTLTIPFQVKIPENGAPTINTQHSNITWILKGVLARRLQKDYQIEQSLQIFSEREN